jgi:hypothetical protein
MILCTKAKSLDDMSLIPQSKEEKNSKELEFGLRQLVMIYPIYGAERCLIGLYILLNE